MMINSVSQGVEDTAAAGTEGGRRPTGVPAAADSKISPGGDRNGLNGRTPQPDPQVVESPVRRRYTKEYKRDILRQIAASTKVGEVGQILRREGLYSSLVSTWRKQEERGQRDGKPANKTVVTSPGQDSSMPQLRRENARLKARLQQAELILEIQKKASEILGISLRTLDNERSD
jgi:transposase-like protein